MASSHLHILSTVTSKGQVTIPKAVRDALQIDTGDKLAFVVTGDEVVVSKTADLLELAGSVKVPRGVAGKPFSDLRTASRVARAKARS